MVHYVRFLRTPHISETTKKSITLSAVITVTTDLGDTFFPQELTLITRVIDATKSGEIYASQDIPWKAGSRAAKVNLQCSEKLASRLVAIHVTTRETIAKVAKNNIPEILDIWSLPFHLKGKQRPEALVERRICLPGKCTVSILEETGDSIARHIWYVCRMVGQRVSYH